jgi:hypothetical protein
MATNPAQFTILPRQPIRCPAIQYGNSVMYGDLHCLGRDEADSCEAAL